MELDDAASRLEALGNGTRLKIYRTLVRAGENGMAVGALQDTLGIAPSTLSHHLKTLRVAGLVNQERHSTTLICRANYAAMRNLMGFLSVECCAEGVCGDMPDIESVDISATTDSGCCGGPPKADAAACCVQDEQAKREGKTGCGCGTPTQKQMAALADS